MLSELDLRYKKREEKTKEVLIEAMQRMAIDQFRQKDAVTAYLKFVNSDPLELAVAMEQYPSPKLFYDLVDLGVIFNAKRFHLSSILYKLNQACSFKERTSNFITINRTPDLPSNELKSLYEGREKDLEYLYITAAEQSTDSLLSLVTGDVPLLRFKRGLLTKDIQNEETVILPTKIPGVMMRYLYPEKEYWPHLTLAIHELNL